MTWTNNSTATAVAQHPLHTLFQSRKTWLTILSTGIALAAYIQGQITAEQLATSIVALAGLLMTVIGVIDAVGKQVNGVVVKPNPLAGLLRSRKAWVALIAFITNLVLFVQGGIDVATLYESFLALATMLTAVISLEDIASSYRRYTHGRQSN